MSRETEHDGAARPDEPFTGLSAEELEDELAMELPERQAMTVISGQTTLPVGTAMAAGVSIDDPAGSMAEPAEPPYS